MRVLLTATVITAIVIAAAGLGAGARAQLPFPTDPDLSQRRQCTRDYVQSLERQRDAMEKLRTAGPDAVGQICSLMELGSAWLDGKLPDELRNQLRDMLGFDVDLERLKAQCRAGQDNLDRELSSLLTQLKAELLRCDDSI